jgi:hypothetical protein
MYLGERSRTGKFTETINRCRGGQELREGELRWYCFMLYPILKLLSK